MTEGDGRGWFATNTFTYSGGLMDYQERVFLGYQYVTDILDEIDIPRLQQQFRELYHGRDEIGRRLRIAFGSVEDRLKAQEESFVSEFLLNLVPAGA